VHHSPLIKQLRAKLGGENVISAPSELAVYDCDAFGVSRHAPEVVVFPRSVEQVAAVVKIADQHEVALVPRGAGTGLSGGCLPIGRSVVLMLTRISRVLEVNLRDRMAVVEAGVSNVQLSNALAGSGLFFAPNPSSRGAGTFGGHAATGAGAPNWLKYGAAVNHILGVEVVLGDGSIVQLGPVDDPASLDLLGLLAGSEGTLGIVTKVWIRLTPLPRHYRTILATFDSVADAANAATQIIAAGIIPSAVQLIDRELLTVIQKDFAPDFPADEGSVLAIECDGLTATLDRHQDQIIAACKNNNAKRVQPNSPTLHHEALWKMNQSIVGALGRLSPDCLIEDGIVPRTKLPALLDKIIEISPKHQVRILFIAHLGAGCVQAIILFDRRDRAGVDRALAAGRELLTECIALGGSVSAQYGIGVKNADFMPRQFQPADLEAMQRVKYAFDPSCRFNPGKVLPEAPGVTAQTKQY
jgi:glycolate oxidase